MAETKFNRGRFLQAIATVMIPFYTLTTGGASYAVIPELAEVYRILGPNDLTIRRANQPTPAPQGAFFKRGDSLLIPSSGRSLAKLRFQKSGQDMGFSVQAEKKNTKNTTLYYFPCTVRQGEASIIEWKTESRDGKRGCEKGVRLIRGRDGNAQGVTKESYAFAPVKQLTAQASRSRQNYCTVLSADGRGWLGISSANDVCEEPLKQCQAKGGKNCDIYTLDNWSDKAQELQASVTCDRNRNFADRASGSSMVEVANKLWQKAEAEGAKHCAFHVIDTQKDEEIIIPATKNNVLFESRNTDSCIEVDVREGEVIAISSKQPLGKTVYTGQRYRYCAESQKDEIETFDAKKESLSVQIFKAEERGYKLCDQKQVSGGQLGDDRIIQLTANQGKIIIDYEMYSVRDKLEVIYEGKTLVNTDFVSGNNRIEVPFKGESGQVRVIVTGNKEINSTQWDYKLHCPL